MVNNSRTVGVRVGEYVSMSSDHLRHPEDRGYKKPDRQKRLGIKIGNKIMERQFSYDLSR